MIPARVDSTSRIYRKTLLFVLLSGISLFDQIKNAFFLYQHHQNEAAEDVRGLIRLLNHKDPDVQYEAAGALGDFGDSSAVEPLITALKNNELSGVRWKAAELLKARCPCR